MSVFYRRLAGIVCAMSFAMPSHAEPVAPLLTTPEAVDVLSYAKPTSARVSHVDIDLTADFAAHTLTGRASLDVIAAPQVAEVILDTYALTVTQVTDAAGHPLPWVLGSADKEKGAPLSIKLQHQRRIIVEYRTSPDATALQWLAPELTAGKQHPYLFSQGEPNNNRSWIPTQDSPGIRQTWTARIVVPVPLRAVMSAAALSGDGEAVDAGHRAFRFRMDKPVPPYLIALAVGDIAFRPLGPRTGVYAEPAMLERAARELAPVETIVSTAESLYGPYRWGRYDVLILPPSFPFGGMENPNLTFATPTIITGDGSNLNVIAHECAHSWSGNLVTNATWSDSWLNEGFTTYFETRIIEKMYGRPRALIQQDLFWDDLTRDIHDAGGPTAPNTRLHGEPNAVYGSLDYTKGSGLLFVLEQAVGRERWDAYLKSYFDRHAFAPQTSAGFLADLRTHLIKGDQALEQRLQLEAWVYQPGLPGNAVHFHSPALAKVDAQREKFLKGDGAAQLLTRDWSTQEWQRFLNDLPRQLSRAQLTDLDQALHLSGSSNAYIRTAWLELVIANRYDPGVRSLEEFLNSVGRTLFVAPLFKGLKAQGEWGSTLAARIYSQARMTYHPMTRAAVEAIISGSADRPPG